MHGLVCIDKAGDVLRPAIIWCDSRAVPYGQQALEALGTEQCLSHLLNSPGNFTAAKLAWVKENEPDTYARIDKIMLPGDYIALKLTGEAVTTVPGLSEGMFWDFRENDVAGFLMNYYGFDRSLIPSILPTFAEQGRVTPAAAAELGLKAGIPVRRVVNIDNDWLFTLTNYEAMPYPSTGIADSEALAAIGAADGQWRHLNVPHDWAIEGEFSEKNPSGTGGGALPGGIGWYRKHFTLADLGLSDKADGQLLIRFDGVYMNSTVWLNGHKLGNRPYGYISFEYDMTPYINKEGDNVLAVRVDNSDQPNSRWYSGCGIFRSVYVTAVNPVHIVPWDTYVLPHAPMAEAYKYGESDSLVITIAEETGTRKATSLQARVTIYNKEKKAVFTTETPITNTTIGLRFRIPGAERWSIENPYLYTAQIELNRDGNVIDDYAFRFGIRDFEFNPEQGFRLNGQPMKLNGVCLHHDLGDATDAARHRNHAGGGTGSIVGFHYLLVDIHRPSKKGTPPRTGKTRQGIGTNDGRRQRNAPCPLRRKPPTRAEHGARQLPINHQARDLLLSGTYTKDG